LLPGAGRSAGPRPRGAPRRTERRANADHNSLNTLGAILYRTGRTEDAIKRLREGIKKDGREDLATDWLFVGMAYHRLGDAKEARAALDKATALVKPRPPGSGAGLRSQQILEEMEQGILLREARSLIDGAHAGAP
jgi:tetratricopeptide (TPR) repeat protein